MFRLDSKEAMIGPFNEQNGIFSNLPIQTLILREEKEQRVLQVFWRQEMKELNDYPSLWITAFMPNHGNFNF